MLNKEWYSKKDILNIYPISNTTYKKRIKDLDPSITKFIKSFSGTPTRLIHYSVIDDLFKKRRKLSPKEKNQIIKWVRNHNWNYFGNVVPGSSNIDDLIDKMRFIFNELKNLQMEKNHLTLFYSIEKNTNDKYYHAHFLIDCAKDMIELKDIFSLLEIICDQNTSKETRIHLKVYNLQLSMSGAIYNSKMNIHYELLS
jgi:hypothetical protein